MIFEMKYLSSAESEHLPAPIDVKSSTANAEFESGIDASSVENPSALGSLPNPPLDFERFMRLMIQVEGAQRVVENIGGSQQFSKYGIIKGTIEYLFKDNIFIKGYGGTERDYLIKKLNSKDNSFTEIEARIFYKKLVSSPLFLVNVPQYSSVFDSNLSLMYADAVVSHGITAANRFFELANNPKNRFPHEKLYAAFVRFRTGAYLGQDYIDKKLQKSESSRNFALESWLNRLDVIDSLNARMPLDDSLCYRELMLDCPDANGLAHICKKWNVDQSLVVALNPNWQQYKVVLIPTMSYHLSENDRITYEPNNQARVFEKVRNTLQQKFGVELIKPMATIDRVAPWKKKYRVLLPLDHASFIELKRAKDKQIKDTKKSISPLITSEPQHAKRELYKHADGSFRFYPENTVNNKNRDVRYAAQNAINSADDVRWYRHTNGKFETYPELPPVKGATSSYLKSKKPLRAVVVPQYVVPKAAHIEWSPTKKNSAYLVSYDDKSPARGGQLPQKNMKASQRQVDVINKYYSSVAPQPQSNNGNGARSQPTQKKSYLQPDGTYSFVPPQKNEQRRESIQNYSKNASPQNDETGKWLDKFIKTEKKYTITNYDINNEPVNVTPNVPQGGYPSKNNNGYSASARMNIQEDLSRNFSSRNNNRVEFIMLHYTGSNSATSAISTLKNTNVKQPVSAHYVIDQAGKVTRLVPDEYAAWHAGKGSGTGVVGTIKSMNEHSIGIELVNDGATHYTDPQMQSLSYVIANLKCKYNIPLENVISHGYYAGGRKPDVGQHFNWGQLFTKVQMLGCD